MAQKSKKCSRNNKQNSLLNGEWGGQTKFGKHLTARWRRIESKREIEDRLKNE